jgi:uncharacterized protein (DUF1015 family)
MARVFPLRGVHFNPEHVKLGGVLAPPYDVINDEQREALYARDLRNIVRVDHGMPLDDDAPGVNDAYTRASAFITSWFDLGLLVRDGRDSVYVSDHEFTGVDGGTHHRRGVFVRVPARGWEDSEVLPHERTLRGPKEDRMALLRASHMQTSPVWVMWAGAPDVESVLDGITATPALLGGRIDGEVGEEKLLLWQVDDETTVAALVHALAPARLYIADGHHRFETAAAYAAERRAGGDADDADSQYTLVYICAGDDPSLELLPTHRLVKPRDGAPYSVDDLLYRLDDAWEAEPVADVDAALRRMRELSDGAHAVGVVTAHGTAVLHRPRREAASARERLDVVVVEEELLRPIGIDAAQLREGAVAFSRSAAEAAAAVTAGQAALACLLNPCSTAEVMAVADAKEIMPQKSTYFYPKVPTGLVMSPV